MDMPDVNLLVAAWRPDHIDHGPARTWLASQTDGHRPFALAESTLASFLRLVTNPRIFHHPDPMSSALEFVERLHRAPRCVLVRPGVSHLDRFLAICAEPGVRANLVPDAWLAALAMESGCRLATRDRDFARFEGLEWHDPLAA